MKLSFDRGVDAYLIVRGVFINLPQQYAINLDLVQWR